MEDITNVLIPEKFRNQNLEVDFRAHELIAKKGIESLNWKGFQEKKEALLHNLRIYQRILRIAKDDDETQLILSLGFSSAHEIARMPAFRFIDQYNSVLGGESNAASIHERATSIKGKTKHLLANIKNHIASPAYKAVSFNNTNEDIDSYLQELPSYQDLFGSLNYVSCDECASIFGPSAYFLDIMRITDEYISEPNAATVPVGFSLQERRPDLFELKLTCANTTDLIPYLTIVNQILQRRIESVLEVITGTAQTATINSIQLDANASTNNNEYQFMQIRIISGTGSFQVRTIVTYDGSTKEAIINDVWTTTPDNTSKYTISKDAYQEIALAPYPFNLPFNLPLQETRTYLSDLKTTLYKNASSLLSPLTGGSVVAATSADITLASNASSEDDFYKNMIVSVCHGTGLGQLRVIRSYNGTTKKATINYDWDIVPDTTSIYNITNILYSEREYLAISHESYEQLITPKSTSSLLSPEYGYTDINKFLIYTGTGTIAFTTNSNLVTGTGTSFATEINVGDQISCKGELRTVLTIDNTNQKLTVDSEWKVDNSGGSNFDIYPQDGIFRLFNFQYRTNLNRDQATSLFVQNLSTAELESNLADDFYINKTGEGLPYMYLNFNEEDPLNPFTEIVNLSVKRLDRINRFVRLASFLDWTYEELDWAMKALGSLEITEELIINLSILLQIQEQSEKSVFVITSFIANLKTSGRGNGRYPKDFFDTIYNNPRLLDGMDPYTSPIIIPFDPVRPLTWQLDSRDTESSNIRSRLTAALMVSDNDLSLIANYVMSLTGKTGSSLTLDMNNLSWLYRIAQAAQISDVTVTELCYAIMLEYYPGGDPFAPPQNLFEQSIFFLLELIRLALELKKMPFSIYQLSYIITGNENEYFKKGYNNESIKIFIRDLSISSESGRLKSTAFVFQDIDSEQAELVYDGLIAEGYISDIGIFSDKEIDYNSIAKLFPISTTSFESNAIDQSYSEIAFDQLKSHNPPYLIVSGGASEGYVSSDFNDSTDLSFLFASKGTGQSQVITAYNGSTKTATLNANWVTIPDTTSYYEIVNILENGTAKSATESTITLDDNASNDNDEYDEALIEIIDGTGKGQSNSIISYNGQSKVATILDNWLVIPDNTSQYQISRLITSGTAVAGTSNTISLAPNASNIDDAYDTMTLSILDLPNLSLMQDEVKVKLLTTQENTLHAIDICKTFKQLQLEFLLNGLSDFFTSEVEVMAPLLVLASDVSSVDNYLQSFLTPLDNDQLPTGVEMFMSVMSRYGMLFSGLSYTSLEIASVIKTPFHFNVTDIKAIQLADMNGLVAFKGMENILGNNAGNELLAYFAIPKDVTCPSVKINKLSEITTWNAEQICQLIDRFWPEAYGDNDYDYNTALGLQRLQVVFAESALTGGDVTTLSQLSNILELNLNDNGSINNSVWEEYMTASKTVLSLVNATYEDSEFDLVFKELNGVINTYKRNGLLGFSIWELNKIIPIIKDPNDLYQYLLIDVEMSSCDITSLIAQAIPSVQLYMSRCRLMLEPGILDIKIPTSWWKWISGYRLWQVNRMIFLYPENYIDPTLRSTETTLFKGLKDELLQAEVNEANVYSAYLNYFDGFNELGEIKYLDSYRVEVKNIETGILEDTIFFFGRTNTDPYTYFYRKYIKAVGKELKTADTWTEWIELEVKINAPYVTPVYAHSKIFIFWIEQENLEEQKVSGGTIDPADTSHDTRAAINYSFLNQAGKWVEPQSAGEYVVEKFVPNSYNPEGYVNPDQINVDALYNQKLYAMKAPPKEISTDPLIEYPERIVLYIGGALRLPNTMGDPTTPPQVTNPDNALFNNSVYQTTYRAAQQAPINPRPGFIFLNPVELLNPNLLANTTRSIILDYNDAIDPQPYKPTLDLDTQILSVIESTNVILDNFMSDYTYRPVMLPELSMDTELDTNPLEIEFKESVAATGSDLPLLYNVSQQNAAIMTVKNQLGWFVYNNGDEEFLLISDDNNLKTISDILIEYNQPVSKVSGETDFSTRSYTSSNINFSNLKFNISRLTTSTVTYLNQILFAGGLDALLTIKSQEAKELPFSRYYKAGTTTPPSTLIIEDMAQFEQLDFYGSYGAYFQEVFFFSPYLIAYQLSNNQQFEEAQKWYQYIFNPTASPDDTLSNPNDRYWNYLPFRDISLQSLEETLSNPVEIAAYNNKPFDPDVIAALRPGAYPKSVVMKYIDNLISWGDYLFAIDTRESIAQATQMYVTASDLLGPRPVSTGTVPPPDPLNYQEIKDYYEKPVVTGDVIGATINTIQLDSNASTTDDVYDNMLVKITTGTGNGQERAIVSYNGATKTATVYPNWATIPTSGSSKFEINYPGIPQFIIELENSSLVTQSTTITGYSDVPFNDINSYFCVPDNAELLSYWDKIEDRLYKIRHCMNISGQVRSLALFAPPIDPRDLIKAMAGGGGAQMLAGQLEVSIPFYKFNYLVEKAQSYTGQLMQLGAALLSALEKKDAEDLALLQNTQEKAILNLTTQIKENAILELQEQALGLNESLLAANSRSTYYGKLVDEGLSPGEISNIVFMTTGMIFNVVGSILRTASAIGYAVPQVGSPFAMTYGGQQLGASIQGAAAAMEVGATVSNFAAQLSLTVAQYQRRSAEWEFQQEQAGYDQSQIGYQISANNIQQEIATRDLQIHEKMIEQNEQMNSFFKDKFTNKELYQWMIVRLSGLYFQTYSLVYEMARSAQSAFQYQYNSNQSFINFDNWSSLHKGLLAGEGLMLSLQQMEKAAIDMGSRSLEINKSISLLQLDPKALLDLKDKGVCYFDLSEKLFDLDFPGHYNRKIVTISISIPAVVGPYQNIKATLTQLTNYVVLKPKINTVSYLLGENAKTAPTSDELRSNWWINQHIALSKGVSDNGMFQLDFNDVRFLPFEGTGAVSTWKLTMPKPTNHINFDSISDVIIDLNYKCSDGGTKFRNEVTKLKALEPYSGGNFYSLEQQFSSGWYSFMNDHTSPTSQSMKFELKDLLPPQIQQKGAKVIGFYFQLVTPEGLNISSRNNFIKYQLTNNDIVDVNLSPNGDMTYLFAEQHLSDPSVESVEDFEQNITIDLANTPADLKIGGFLDPAAFQNINLIIFYFGKIDWDQMPD